MAEILIRVVDKINTDPGLNAQCTKYGDIVVAVDNNHPWSNEEKTASYWRIIKIPDMPLSEALDLTTPEVAEINGQSFLLLKRALKLDIDAMPTVVKNAILAEPRPTYYTVTASSIRNYFKRKGAAVPRANINVISTPPV